MRRAVLTAALGAFLFTAVYAAQQPASSAAHAAPGAARVDFVRDVRPILEQHCYECHGPDKQMNGFRLDRRRDAMRGGTLHAIATGSAASSRLYLRLAGSSYGRRMPLDADPLNSTEIDTIRKWIDQGAVWPAKFRGRAQFIGCVGLQDEDAGRRLTEAFLQGWESVQSLRFDNAVDDTCWFAGDGWWLSTAAAEPASED